jgi:hypothetical protein
MSINIIITFLHVRSAASVSTLLCHIALMLIASKCKECEVWFSFDFFGYIN